MAAKLVQLHADDPALQATLLRAATLGVVAFEIQQPDGTTVRVPATVRTCPTCGGRMNRMEGLHGYEVRQAPVDPQRLQLGTEERRVLRVAWACTACEEVL